MRFSVLLGAVSTCSACSAATPAPGAQVPAAPVAAASAKASAERSGSRAPTQREAPGHLNREFTGQKQPSLVVENRVGSRQHVFIDWTMQGELAPGASARFELAPGSHTVTCSDSTDPDDNPASVTETFETGFSYAYSIGQP